MSQHRALASILGFVPRNCSILHFLCFGRGLQWSSPCALTLHLMPLNINSMQHSYPWKSLLLHPLLGDTNYTSSSRGKVIRLPLSPDHISIRICIFLLIMKLNNVALWHSYCIYYIFHFKTSSLWTPLQHAWSRQSKMKGIFYLSRALTFCYTIQSCLYTCSQKNTRR